MAYHFLSKPLTLSKIGFGPLDTNIDNLCDDDNLHYKWGSSSMICCKRHNAGKSNADKVIDSQGSGTDL